MSMDVNKDVLYGLEKLHVDAIKKYAPPQGSWLPPDDALFGPKMIFNVPDAEAGHLRFKAIKYAFNHHYTNCSFYHRFCKELDVKPDDIKTEDDFKKIPLISDILFKDYPEPGSDFINWLKKIYVGDFPDLHVKTGKGFFDRVIDSLQKNDITMVFSSGTSGKFSFVPRDKTTWGRQMYVCSRIFEFSSYDFYQTSKYKILWLGPNPRKTHLYIGRLTLMLLDLFNENNVHFGIRQELTTEAIKILMGTTTGLSGRFKSSVLRPFLACEENKIMERFIGLLEEVEKKDELVGIGGTPFFIEFLLSKIEKKGLKFDIEGGFVVTAGGWKTFSGMEIPGKELRGRIEKYLGIPQDNCRDIYGMVECNALNVSCEGHYKHIPHSILYPMVLDENSEPIGFDEYGRFAFLDPLSNSYPGFIMTGDKVKILEHCPVCDRPGPVIVGDVSRMSGIQDRGCGATLARMFSEEIKKTKEEKKIRI